MKKFKNILEKINPYIIKILSFLFLNFKKDISLDKIKNVLIICQMGIGNCILFIPIIKKLQEILPNAQITVIVDKKMLKDIINNNLSNVNILVKDFRKQKVLNRLKYFIKMRKQKYDLFLTNFLGIKKENIQLALVCQIPYRIGHLKKNIDNIGKYDFFFNHPIPIKKEHELDLNFRLLEPLGNSHNQHKQKKTYFNIDNKSLEKGKQFINSIDNKLKIVLQIYSFHGKQKNWGNEKYKKLVEKLSKEMDVKIILTGSKNEYPIIENIFNNSPIDYTNIAGKYNIAETASIIKYADLFIGNDSGLGHIAGAIGQKTIIIIGMTDENRIKAIGEKVSIVHKNVDCSPCDAFLKDKEYLTCKHKKCMNLITVDEVYSLIALKLRGNLK